MSALALLPALDFPPARGVSPVLVPPPPVPASAPPGRRRLRRPPPPRRLALGIDAADVAGVATWEVTDEPVYLDTREGARFRAAYVVRRTRAGFTEAMAVDFLDELLDDAEWMATIERPFGIKTKWVDGRKVRKGTPPTAGFDFWCRVVDLVARRRAQRLRRRFREPLVVELMAGEWRAPLGVALSGDCKASAVAWLHRIGVDVREHNAAEAACIAAHAARMARQPLIITARSRPEPMRWAA